MGPVTPHRVAIIQRQPMHEQVRKYGPGSLVNQPILKTLAAADGSSVTKKEQCSEAVPNEPMPTFTAVNGQGDEE
jgi:hypothetical protein